MGNYNPTAPSVVGNEFVGIRNENLTLPVQLDSVETGYSFTTTATRTIVDARIYAQTSGSRTGFGRVPVAVNVYPQGAEAKSGPLQSVVIPCNAGFGVGDSNLLMRANNTTIASGFAPSTNVAPAVQGFGNASATENTVNFAEGPQYNFFYAYFDVQTYAQQLVGKRVIAVNLLYKLQGNDSQAAADGTIITWGYVNGASGQGTNVVGSLASANGGNVTIQRASLGSIVDGAGYFPLSLATLLQFQASQAVGSRRGIMVFRRPNTGTIGAFTTIYNLTYLSLEVIYCEEQRVLAGIAEPADPAGGAGFAPPGTWVLQMKDIAGNTNPSLSAGSYTVTCSAPEFLDFNSQVFPNFNALRMLYRIPSHPGIQINKPYPAYNNIGSVFTSQLISVIPQLTLNTSTGPIPETQVYGRIAPIPVFNNNGATQVLDTSNIPTGTYAFSRFYARYFGTPDAALSMFVSGSGSNFITRAQFDALPAIVDGWKEITLPWGPASLTGGSSYSVLFSSTGTFIANRWEVLGVQAPSLTGIAGSNVTQAAQQLGAASYLQPNGTTAELTWRSPLITGTAADPTADAVLMFSQMPVIPSGSAATADGTFESGIAGWTTTGAVLTQSGAQHHSGLFSGLLTATGSPSSINARSITPVNGGELMSYTGWLFSSISTSNAFLSLDWLDSGGNYISSSGSSTTAIAPNTWTFLSFSGNAPSNAAFVSYGWSEFGNPPNGTLLYADDLVIIGQRPLATLMSQALTGVGVLCGTLNESLPNGLSYVRLTWTSAGVTGFGYNEIQRFDPIDNAWNSVMLSTTQGQTTFNDYEARVGQTSQYRMRTANTLGFLSGWSVSVPITIPAPGVTGGTNVGNSVLIFTSNGAQLGERNMAYTQLWDGDVSEDLAFPEVQRSSLQWMYGKDFQTAFMPTERGGEQFTRTILVQNATISGPQIQNGFRSLRDLGWAQLPYVCVRNELGDRWYANVQVPSAVIQRNRRLQMAQIQITEVSSIPAVIDPAVSQ